MLDVGCGPGELLEELAAAGVRACGLESSRARLGAARPRRAVGDATRLPLRTGACDVVTVRHVLHHLPDPAGAVREAARVAARALVLAEPWLDPGAPDADLARRVEEWRRIRDRRAGAWHDPDHTPAEIAAMLPGAPDAWSLRVRLAPGSGRVAASVLREELADRMDAELAALLARVGPAGLPLSGSAIVVAVRTG